MTDELDALTINIINAHSMLIFLK